MTPAWLLQQWLDQQLDASAAVWLREAASSLAGGGSDRDLYRSISLVSRKLGKAPLRLDAAALAQAAQVRVRWDPSVWTVDQAARVRLLLATCTACATGVTPAADSSRHFVRRLDQLCATADVDELVAFYAGLPLYPEPALHRQRAAEGLRSNMRVVFEAVAHRNPYAAEQLPEDAWNQMVLKALFVGSSLAPVVGLDERANATLARMLGDYAHERWAASRPINPELWRCVGPFATGPLLADLARVLDQGSAPEKVAAVLALRSANSEAARALLDRHAPLRDAVAARHASWATVLEPT